jgi:hypothetical protein
VLAAAGIERLDNLGAGSPLLHLLAWAHADNQSPLQYQGSSKAVPPEVFGGSITSKLGKCNGFVASVSFASTATIVTQSSIGDAAFVISHWYKIVPTRILPFSAAPALSDHPNAHSQHTVIIPRQR